MLMNVVEVRVWKCPLVKEQEKEVKAASLPQPRCFSILRAVESEQAHYCKRDVN